MATPQTETPAVQHELKVPQIPFEYDEISLTDRQIPTEVADQATPSVKFATFYNSCRGGILIPLFIGTLMLAITGQTVTVGKGRNSHVIYPPAFVKAVPITTGVSFGVSVLSLIATVVRGRGIDKYELSPVNLVTQAGMSVALLTTSIITQTKQEKAGCMSLLASSDMPACIGAPIAGGVGIFLGVLCTMLFLIHLCLFIKTWQKNRETNKSDRSGNAGIV